MTNMNILQKHFFINSYFRLDTIFRGLIRGQSLWNINQIFFFDWTPLDTIGHHWTQMDTNKDFNGRKEISQQSFSNMETQTCSLSPFHRLVDSPFNADDIDPKGRELIFSQLQLLRKEKYADFKRYVVTKSSSLYTQNEWVADSWELCCYGDQVDFDDFQSRIKEVLLPFDLKTLNFYQSALKKQFGGEDTTVSIALLEFNSIHWVTQFKLSPDTFGSETSISYRPIYEIEMMKAYNMKQAKKSATPTRYMPMKSSYRPHESFVDLFTPRKQIKLDESMTGVATPEKSPTSECKKMNTSLQPKTQVVGVQGNKDIQAQSNLGTKEANQKEVLKKKLMARKLALEKELMEFDKAEQINAQKK